MRSPFLLVYLACCLLSLPRSTGQLFRPQARFSDNASGVTVMARHPEGKMVINGDRDGNLYFRDASTGQVFRKIKAHQAPVNTLSFNSNGQLLISSTFDGEIRIYDFQKDNFVQSIYSPDYAGIRFVLFSIADGFIYFNSNSRLYKTRSDLTQKVDLIRQEDDTLYDAVIAADRSAVIYSKGHSLHVLNTRSDLLRQEFSPGPFPIRYMNFLNDTTLVTWSDDGTLAFWSFRMGQLALNPTSWMKAGLPCRMAFSSDGKFMATGMVGNWARVWSPQERAIFQELFGHQQTVTATCFGKNDHILFTGSNDRSVRVWSREENKTSPPDTNPIPPPLVVDTTPLTVKPPEIDTVHVAQHEQVKAVEVADNNIPKSLGGRQVISAGSIEVNSPTLTISVYDNSFIDGDTLSLYFNGKCILDHYGVVKQKRIIHLQLEPDINNYLILFAENLGLRPPNTAAILVNDGKTDRFFRLSSDMKVCSSLNFTYNKK
jgi:WD40 repeat protein